MYGYQCKHCGARLDPGEVCDCRTENNREDNEMKQERYSEWLDRLTIEDIEKLAMQGYKIVISNGHIVAVQTEEKEPEYGA